MGEVGAALVRTREGVGAPRILSHVRREGIIHGPDLDDLESWGPSSLSARRFPPKPTPPRAQKLNDSAEHLILIRASR